MIAREKAMPYSKKKSSSTKRVSTINAFIIAPMLYRLSTIASLPFGNFISVKSG
jgi:hypothetical protein